jgi:uncharacterized protein (UPF0548 family)
LAEWRVARGWSDAEVAARLGALRDAACNFDTDPAALTSANGWRKHQSDAVVAEEAPGPPLPDGPFARGRVAVADYEFSDPSIVTGHFDRAAPLLGRDLLLEIKVLGLRYLCGARVGAVREEEVDDTVVFGFRYDTLDGHIETGSEWFLLTKSMATGAISFRIVARWRRGDFPNWWSRAGFSLLAPRYQRRWHYNAHHRLATIVNGGVPPARALQGGRLIEIGLDLET